MSVKSNSSDWVPRIGETIEPDPEYFLVIEVDKDRQLVLLEFEHQGRMCRVWAPMDEFEEVNRQ